MRAFRILKGLAAPLPMANIDTDAIIPKQFLKTIKRTGLGQHLFYEMRYFEPGHENPNFVLNQPAYRNASILVAGANFGCGSSREHAPWALDDFGIRVVIAESFADIFHNNCFKNGLLPIVLPKDQVETLMNMATENKSLTVDLETETITAYPDNINFKFTIDPFRKKCLLEGLDEIGLTLARAEKITSFEDQSQKTNPWL